MNSQKILAIFICLSFCLLATHLLIAQTSQSKNEEIISQIQGLRQQNDELIKGEQNAIEKIRMYGDLRLKNEYLQVGNLIAGLAKDAAVLGVPGFIAGSLKEIGVGLLDLNEDKLPPSLLDKAKAASVAISLASGKAIDSFGVVGAGLKTSEKVCDVMIDYYTSVHELLLKQQHQNNLKIKELESNLTADEINRARAFPTSNTPRNGAGVLNFPQLNFTPDQQSKLSLQDQFRFAFREYEIKMRDFYYNENKKYVEKRQMVQNDHNKEDMNFFEKLSKVPFGSIERGKIILEKARNSQNYWKEENEIDHEWRMFTDTYNLELDKNRKIFEQKLLEYKNKSTSVYQSQSYQLVKSPDNPTVYILKDGKKYAIQGAEDFNALGLDWKQIKTIPTAQLKSIDVGGYINESNAANYSQQLLGRPILGNQGFVKQPQPSNLSSQPEKIQNTALNASMNSPLPIDPYLNQKNNDYKYWCGEYVKYLTKQLGEPFNLSSSDGVYKYYDIASRNNNYSVSNKPISNSIMILDASAANGNYGHAAFVDNVIPNSDGSFTIHYYDANWATIPKGYDTNKGPWDGQIREHTATIKEGKLGNSTIKGFITNWPERRKDIGG